MENDLPEPRLFRTGVFAKMARISERTLRYYDRIGLLSPSERTFSGHRLYAESDLLGLQRILALKLLGFSLSEIRALAKAAQPDFRSVLVQQRAMLQDRREQIDRALSAIDEVEAQLEDRAFRWEAVLRVIEAMQMNDKEQVQRHLTPEQLAAVREVAGRSYSPEAAERLSARPWTEEDQAKATADWNAFYSDAERLAAQGADPEGEEGRELGRRYQALIEAFTGGDSEIAAGLDRFYAEATKLPAAQNPYPSVSDEARRFCGRAYEAVRKG